MSLLKVNSLQDLGADAVVTDGVIVSSALPAGSLLQVVSTTKTDAFSLSASGYQDVPGLSVSITPSSASSKILILFHVVAGNSVTAGDVRVNLVRDSTNIAQGTTGTSVNSTTAVKTGVNYVPYTVSLSHLDSPASASSITYKIQIAKSTGVATVNRRGDNAANGMVSSITLMEVAG
tara:strand:- start:751 stop:1281 length:531 start_codon:yes stop_codon:yes gene_type:complete